MRCSPGSYLHTFPAVALVTLLAFAQFGCSERDLSTLAPAPGNTDPVVFDDAFGDGVDYQAFADSRFDAVTLDSDQARVGTTSLRVTIPEPGSTDGTFAGGAFTSSDYRDLTGYDALVFYAKSSIPSDLNVAGLGNDNTGTSLYEASREDIPLTEEWSLVIVPIPDPSRLSLERGLFFFAEAHENNMGFTVWFDEIRFARVETITSPRPAMAPQDIETFLGATITPEDTRVTFSVNGEDVLVKHSARYFDYFSSNEDVARIDSGVITAAGGGTATVTAKLDTVEVTGAIDLNVLAPPDVPAPAPTYPTEDVIALFSDAYENVPVDTWRAEWSASGPVEDYAIEGDNTKVYTGLSFAGIEFADHLIDATDRTHIRLDVWAPVGTVFKVKLVDFGPDGEYDEPVDESELTFTAESTPRFVAGQWSILDIPLSDFTLMSRANLAQIIISSPDAKTVFLDNVLFH
ncbi:MAG: hypothetical protein GF355_15725 [Candidatus Eisenbacteria bacterium]|nr:hypothetical protein [Candidatus Eisenbacteria bacterium]